MDDRRRGRVALRHDPDVEPPGSIAVEPDEVGVVRVSPDGGNRSTVRAEHARTCSPARRMVAVEAMTFGRAPMSSRRALEGRLVETDGGAERAGDEVQLVLDDRARAGSPSARRRTRPPCSSHASRANLSTVPIRTVGGMLVEVLVDRRRRAGARGTGMRFGQKNAERRVRRRRRRRPSSSSSPSGMSSVPHHGQSSSWKLRSSAPAHRVSSSSPIAPSTYVFGEAAVADPEADRDRLDRRAHVRVVRCGCSSQAQTRVAARWNCWVVSRRSV